MLSKILAGRLLSLLGLGSILRLDPERWLPEYRVAGRRYHGFLFVAFCDSRFHRRRERRGLVVPIEIQPLQRKSKLVVGRTIDGWRLELSRSGVGRSVQFHGGGGFGGDRNRHRHQTVSSGFGEEGLDR